MKLPYKVYSNYQYWNWRKRIFQYRFWFRKNKIQTKNLIREEKRKISSTVFHVKLALWSIIKAAGVMSLLFFIEHSVTSFWTLNFEKIPYWLIDFENLIPKPHYPDDKDAIIEIVSVIASITGVILALFYPMLATIASTGYAKVHASIRNLLISEEETQGYLRRLTYLTASSIIVLLLMSFHYLPGNLVLSFLAFYSFSTLFGILKIGLGVYNFFEPSTLSGIVIKKITDAIKNVTTEGVYWNDKNFQQYYHKIALEQSQNLALITNLCVKENDLNESSFKSCVGSSFLILKQYLFQKQKIPVDSLWYPNVYNHLSYFESDMTLRDLSKNTSTFIRPSIKQDHLWLEEKIVNNLSNVLEKISKGKHVNVLSETIIMTYPVISSLCQLLDLKTGEFILKTYLKNIHSISRPIQDELNYDNLKDQLGAAESYCYALLRLQAGIIDRITQFNSAKIELEFSKIKWDDSSSIYSTDFIPELYDSIKRFYGYFENENSVEGKSITPDWWYKQALTAEYLQIIVEKIEKTIGFFKVYLISLARNYENINNPLLTSYVAQVGLEIIFKIRYRLTQLKSALNDIDKLEVCKGEFTWSKPNYTTLENTIKDQEQKCILIISKNIEKISAAKWNNQYPDIFGQSYSILSTHLNQAFIDNNVEEIEQHFPVFLKSAITAFGNLNLIFRNYALPQNISYQTLIDVMQISGLSYIYSILYKNPKYWHVVKGAWDTNFQPTTENIALMSTFYNYYKSNLFGTGINFNEKFQRERGLNLVTERLKIKEVDVEDILVKPFISGMHDFVFDDAAELFMEIYLFTFPNAKTAALSLRNRHIFENIIREIEYNNYRLK